MSQANRTGPISRSEAIERLKVIFYEEGAADMDLSEPVYKSPTRLQTAWLYVKHLAARRRDSLVRFWVWNVVFPVKMWWHFAFNTGGSLPDDRRMLAALLREGFSEAGITDDDLPYPLRSDSDVISAEKVEEPGRWDRFFNRRRVDD